jgi:hypothetical protein
MSSTNHNNQRVAMFRNTKYDFVTVLGIGPSEKDDWTMEEYIRISEWQSVEFKPLSKETLAEAEMTALTKLRAETVEEFKEKLNSIDGRIANLRALSGPVEEPSC